MPLAEPFADISCLVQTIGDAGSGQAEREQLPAPAAPGNAGTTAATATNPCPQRGDISTAAAPGAPGTAFSRDLSTVMGGIRARRLREVPELPGEAQPVGEMRRNRRSKGGMGDRHSIPVPGCHRGICGAAGSGVRGWLEHLWVQGRSWKGEGFWKRGNEK